MKKKIRLILTFLVLTLFTCSCGKSSDLLNQFEINSNTVINYTETIPLSYSSGFASNIAIIPEGADNSEGSTNIYSDAALLIDATTGEVIFNKNPYNKEYPASTTKILTALVALKYGDTSASRTIGDEIYFNEGNVVVCDYREGDVVPFEILIHGSLLKSGNDAAGAIANLVSGDFESFSVLMNEEAKRLGATESNFVNPHGLYNDNHYTTAYDMYLIFNEAIKYDYFINVISAKSYSGTFNRVTNYGEYVINCSYFNNNKYVTGEIAAPSHVKVIGGKAGYTEVARRSYVMLAEANGHQYIFVVMKSNSIDEMYHDLNYLLNLVPVKIS